MRGFTLIDVLVGITLMVIFFAGIFGLYQLGLKVVAQSENRIVATAIANEYLEMARNLPYADVGVQGGQMMVRGLPAPPVELVDRGQLPREFTLALADGDSVPPQSGLGPTLPTWAEGVGHGGHELPTRGARQLRGPGPERIAERRVRGHHGLGYLEFFFPQSPC